MEFYNTTEEEIVKEILDLKSPIGVCTHHDADGIYSAALLRAVTNKEFELYIPDRFGEYGDVVEVGFRGKKQPIHVSLDIGKPLEPYTGICIDHHSHERPIEGYKLAWGHVPTGLLVYNLFKDHIPDNKKWLVAGSIVGDGQPEYIPTEIWDMFPELLESRGTMYESYGKLKTYNYPVYKLIASPVNAMCRMNNNIEAFKLVVRARSPDSIIDNPAAVNDQLQVAKEESNIMRQFGTERKRRTKTMGDFMFLTINSEINVVGRIATKLMMQNQNNTIIVMNENGYEGSIRGDRTTWLIDKLNSLGYSAGGHAKYGGLKLLPNQTLEDFELDLRRVIRGSIDV